MRRSWDGMKLLGIVAWISRKRAEDGSLAGVALGEPLPEARVERFRNPSGMYPRKRAIEASQVGDELCSGLFLPDRVAPASPFVSSNVGLNAGTSGLRSNKA